MAKNDATADFIRKHTGSRKQLNAGLKRLFGVKLRNTSEYIPHAGLKQRLKNLMRTGLTREQALDKLSEAGGPQNGKE